MLNIMCCFLLVVIIIYAVLDVKSSGLIFSPTLLLLQLALILLLLVNVDSVLAWQMILLSLPFILWPLFFNALLLDNVVTLY